MVRNFCMRGGQRQGLNSLVKAHLDLVHDLSFKSATFFPKDKKPLFKILKMTNPNYWHI